MPPIALNVQNSIKQLAKDGKTATQIQSYLKVSRNYILSFSKKENFKLLSEQEYAERLFVIGKVLKLTTGNLLQYRDSGFLVERKNRITAGNKSTPWWCEQRLSQFSNFFLQILQANEEPLELENKSFLVLEQKPPQIPIGFVQTYIATTFHNGHLAAFLIIFTN